MVRDLAFRIAAFFLVGDGVAALYLAGLLDNLGALLVVAALALAWIVNLSRLSAGGLPMLARILILVVAGAVTLDLVYIAPSLLDGFVYLLLLLVLLRLFTARSSGDLRDAGLISFFMLVASAAMTFDISQLVVFIVYLILVTWLLMLHHFMSESARTSEGARPTPRVGLDVVRVALAAPVAVLFVTASLFFIIPRVGQASLPGRTELRRMVTGFTSEVELGAIGEIESDSTVVMRVYLPNGMLGAIELPALRWRGIALDQFNGRTWAVGRPDRLVVPPLGPGQFQIGAPRPGGRIVTQEIFLDPIGTEILFAAPHVLRLHARAGAVMVDDAGSLFAAAPSARLQYTVESQLETRSGSGGRTERPLAAATRARYLQLPPLSAPVPALARELTAGSRDQYDAATRLTAFFLREFRYTLTQTRTTDRDPLDEFLFVRRSGNCEYFSTALAILLRTIDIPARVVNGFQHGEWNPYGDYFVVRLSDAHSWVEAYIDGRGWVTLDASPRDPTGTSGASGPLGLYLDALRMRWYRYIVNWSLKDQIVVAATIKQAARRWQPGLPSLGQWTVARGLVVLGPTLVVGALAWWLWRSGRWGRFVGARRSVPEFYRRALAILARRGVRPAAGETAREFCARVGAEVPVWSVPFAAVTIAYERVRFGAHALAAADVGELDIALAALAARDASRP